MEISNLLRLKTQVVRYLVRAQTTEVGHQLALISLYLEANRGGTTDPGRALCSGRHYQTDDLA